MNRSTTGPAKSTIIEVISTPASVDTNVNAARTAPAPIVANTTPNQYTISLPEKAIELRG